MGYETTIYIGAVSKHEIGTRNNRKWFHNFATIDCSQLGGCLVDEETKKNGIPCYIYADDGDTEKTVDCYGESLVAIPIKKVIEALAVLLKDDKYTRAQWAYDALRSMKKKRKGYHGMVATHCVLFGH